MTCCSRSGRLRHIIPHYTRYRNYRPLFSRPRGPEQPARKIGQSARPSSPDGGEESQRDGGEQTSQRQHASRHPATGHGRLNSTVITMIRWPQKTVTRQHGRLLHRVSAPHFHPTWARGHGFLRGWLRMGLIGTARHRNLPAVRVCGFNEMLLVRTNPWRLRDRARQTATATATAVSPSGLAGGRALGHKWSRVQQLQGAHPFRQAVPGAHQPHRSTPTAIRPPPTTQPRPLTPQVPRHPRPLRRAHQAASRIGIGPRSHSGGPSMARPLPHGRWSLEGSKREHRHPTNGYRITCCSSLCPPALMAAGCIRAPAQPRRHLPVVPHGGYINAYITLLLHSL